MVKPQNNKASVDPKLTKKKNELLKTVRLYKPRHTCTYTVDRILQVKSFALLRLPPHQLIK
jgi:hypothetical protein